MLLELLTHISSLDIAWLYSLVANNLLWWFILALLAHFIYGKGPILGTVFVGAYLFTTFDLSNILGWVFQKGLIWVPIIGLLCLLGFDACFPQSKKRGIFAGIIFYLALCFVNIGLG